MRDPRITQLADGLINYSVKLQPGEKVLIENFGVEESLVEALVEKAYEAGGHPFVLLKESRILRKLYTGASREQLELMADIERDVVIIGISVDKGGDAAAKVKEFVQQHGMTYPVAVEPFEPLQWPVADFALVESITDRSGSLYTPLAAWRLLG